MALDPILKQLLDRLPPPSSADIDYPKLRAQADALMPLIVGPDGLAEVASCVEHYLDGPGGSVPIRIYRPLGTTKGTLHFVHGGGWSLGNLGIVDPAARRFCRDLSMVVVTSTYRLAPEHPFPAAFDDTLVAARWVLAHAAELGGSSRPAVIGGDSAGGNLAGAVCLALRDPVDATATFDAQLLLYPAVDLRPDAPRYPSRVHNADPSLRAEVLPRLMSDYYAGADPKDYRLSPLCAESLANLPRALVVVLKVDPLHDEAVVYGERLKKAGVAVELMEFDNLTHGFVTLAGLVPAAAQATHAVIERLKSLVGIAN